MKRKKDQQDESTTEHLSYLDVCARYHLDPKKEDIDTTIKSYLDLGAFTRKKLPKKQADKALKAGFGESAQFLYFVAGRTRKVINGRSESQRFYINQKIADDEDGRRLRRDWFAKISVATRNKITGDELVKTMKSRAPKDKGAEELASGEQPPPSAARS